MGVLIIIGIGVFLTVFGTWTAAHFANKPLIQFFEFFKNRYGGKYFLNKKLGLFPFFPEYKNETGQNKLYIGFIKRQRRPRVLIRLSFNQPKSAQDEFGIYSKKNLTKKSLEKKGVDLKDPQFEALFLAFARNPQKLVELLTPETKKFFVEKIYPKMGQLVVKPNYIEIQVVGFMDGEKDAIEINSYVELAQRLMMNI